MSGVGQGTGGTVKRGIVVGLWLACECLDRLPGQWGCRLQIAARSCDLDERWGTGAWKATEETGVQI